MAAPSAPTPGSGKGPHSLAPQPGGVTPARPGERSVVAPAHPLAGLVAPLRYACQRDFAQLSTVKDLRTPLEHALAGAASVEADVVALLRSALPEVDSADLERRKAALRRVVAALARSGLQLPEELARVALGPQAPAPLPAVADAPRAPVEPRPQVPAWKSLAPLPPTPGSRSARRTETPPALPRLSTPGETRRANPHPSPLPEGEGALRSAPAVASAAPQAQAPQVKAPPVKAAEVRPPSEAAPEPSSAQKALLPEAVKPEKPKKPGKPRKKAAKGEEEPSAEARLLSIAPGSGPLAKPLNSLKRMGPRLLAALERKGLKQVAEVLFLLPRCYEDRRRLRTIAELIPGERGVTVGVVKTAGTVPSRQGRRIFRAVVADRSGSIAAVHFNVGPWLEKLYPLGKRLILSGEVRATLGGREMAHPEIEPAEDLEVSSVHFNRIVPLYPGFERWEQRAFRELAAMVSEQYARHVDEPLPESLRRRLGFMPLPEALQAIHFPPEGADVALLDQHMSPAHRRLAFDELFFLQLGLGLKRQGVKVEPGIAFNVSPERLEQARAALPFRLTGAQERVVQEIARDMARPEPMSRLVQGDVGSGKTAVAVVASLLALRSGFQVAVMAPTEILAEQHARNFQRLLAPLEYHVGLVSASGPAKARRKARELIERGEIHLAVGTHALLEEDVKFKRLGLAVIDEQHRFGVLQRHTLMSKGKEHPDVLVMTATPIPRTLAMTMYGDLDLSIIDELPPGRTPVVTKVYPQRQRGRVWEAVAAEVAKGHQAYVVYPLVEESEKLDLESATEGAEKLREIFPGRQVGLLHGRLRAEEKEAVMNAFREKRVDILVSTTVVEVGVDVPNASVMVIESAERFGLSQLHQLRGRVGRGAARSHCFLVAGAALSHESIERLSVMEQSSDGFVIAEKDLELRGPGEFLGTRQSGLPELAVANLARDGDLIALAQQEARRILAQDAELRAAEHQGLVRALSERWEGRLALARVG